LLGAVSAASLNAGAGGIYSSGALTAGTATIGTMANLNISGTVDCDLVFSPSGAAQRVRFAGVSDSGWLAFQAHDSSAENPWYKAASTHSSDLKLGIDDNLGTSADSVRIDGCKGIYLKAADYVVSCNICESICTISQDINPRWVFI
jgi:hypothetical protein